MTAVITGVGAVSAFGVGMPALLGGLAEGRAAIGTIKSFDASTFPTRVAGEVPGTIDARFLSDRLGASAPGTREPATPDRLGANEPGTREPGTRDRLGANEPGTREPGTRDRLGANETARVASQIAELAASGALRDRKIAFAMLAAAEAWRNARCGAAEQDAGLVIALGLEHAFLEDFAPIFAPPDPHSLDLGRRMIRWDLEPSEPSTAIRFRSRVDLAAVAVRELLALAGPTVVNSSACAAGTLAVAHAASLIERGAASVVVCGASDSMVNPLGLGGMCRLGAPSPRNESDACRPFDRARDGLVIGEGSAMFVVEDEARAAARGARVLARVLGWGSTQDAYRVTAPRPDGAAARRVMERALARARLAPEAIGYINAHGTGTPLNDPAESKAIHGAFGAHAERIAVSSIKGAVGHLMAAAGAIELAASLLVFERDLLPGTAHHRDRDPECPLDVIGETPRHARVDALLSNSFGFGGQNASIILGRPA